LGRDIDTDQIIPAEHLVYDTHDPEERKNYGKFALSSVPMPQSGLPQGNIPFVKEGEFESEYCVIVADKNFGCGSSREHAPLALQIAGIQAVVAPSYARIYYRNSVDGGFLIPYESKESITAHFETGQEVEIDKEANTITNTATGNTYSLEDLGDAGQIVADGGIFNHARKLGMIKS
jgi:3-isopropylmalate/(R)-2-methylmalate dehydratase small subunit